jgi:hypothetical protein
MIDSTLASRFASLALAHVRREYPNKLDHVLNGSDDLRSPRDLHPIFYGSFDWHSNVHGYWLLATLYRRVPEFPERVAIRELLDIQFTSEKVAGELAYLSEPMRAGFERPYGWAWLLMLAAELYRHDSDVGRRWSIAIAPLAKEFVKRFFEFLPKSTYPIRAGTHANSAFALALATEYARTVDNGKLSALIYDRATLWFAGDRDCQAWEPSGDDFLSSALMEAECMRRVLDRDAWRIWMNHFLPRLAGRDPVSLFEPATVSDRTDGKIAHLDGLNLSRAWCWRSIASAWDESDGRRTIALVAAEEHLLASLGHVAGDYAGEHWLATYALLALLAPDGASR